MQKKREKQHCLSDITGKKSNDVWLHAKLLLLFLKNEQINSIYDHYSKQKVDNSDMIIHSLGFAKISCTESSLSQSRNFFVRTYVAFLASSQRASKGGIV